MTTVICGRGNLKETRDVAHTCTTWQYIAACASSKSLTTAKLLNETSTRSKSTVNSSQRCQTRQSTHLAILQCDELTGSHFSLPYNFPDRQRGWTQEPAKVGNVVQIAIFGSFSPSRGDSIQRLRLHLARNILDAVTFLSLMLNFGHCRQRCGGHRSPKVQNFH